MSRTFILELHATTMLLCWVKVLSEARIVPKYLGRPFVKYEFRRDCDNLEMVK